MNIPDPTQTSHLPEDFRLSSYHYDLPRELIALHPAEERSLSRLLVCHKANRTLAHRSFQTLAEMIPAGDVLVINTTRVFPARFIGRKASGGAVEMLLLQFPRTWKKETGNGHWHHTHVPCLLKASKRPKAGQELFFGERIRAMKEDETGPDGRTSVRLSVNTGEQTPEAVLEEAGCIPLPPYIQRDDTTEDRERYQTVYAAHTGSVAAPTAGLHFTPTLLQTLRNNGVTICDVTLHVGYGTFAPVRSEDIRRHAIHREHVFLPAESAALINQAKREGRKVWAVGTTTARALEFMAHNEMTRHGQQWCDLYIYPGYRFKVVDNLVTNFHLPGSSLLFLLAAFAGREQTLAWYQEAIREKYRFYSYGDAMAVMGGQQPF